MSEDQTAVPARPACPTCGHVGEPFSRFCSRCGTPLAGQLGDSETGVLPRIVDGPGPSGPVATAPVAVSAPESQQGSRRARLVVQRGPDEGASFELGQAPVQIGRAPEADLFLDDVTVSRRHADIIGRDGGWQITDAGSLNGTYVNRVRIEQHALQPGDEVQIGKYRFAFEVGAE